MRHRRQGERGDRPWRNYRRCHHPRREEGPCRRRYRRERKCIWSLSDDKRAAERADQDRMRDALAVTWTSRDRRLDVLPDLRKYSIEYAFWPGQGQDSGIRPYCTRFRVVSGNADRDIVDCRRFARGP